MINSAAFALDFVFFPRTAPRQNAESSVNGEKAQSDHNWAPPCFLCEPSLLV
jgi:hypothetical protein